MAIVKGFSNLVPRSLGGVAFPDPQATAGLERSAYGNVTNLLSDNATSKYRLCDLPSDCYLHEETMFKVDLWGFATLNLGTETAPTAIGTVLRASGATWSPIVFGDARHGIELWSVLGLAADPGGFIPIWLHGPADATVAGSLKFRFKYVHRS